MARILRNISYVTNATQQQQLDLYLPTNATNETPLIVYLHGGAWLHRDKADYAYFAGFWAIEHGLACAVLNYTLSPERPSSVIHPVHVNDCADAIAWLHRDTEHTYDHTRMYLVGHSAGGMLAGQLVLGGFLASRGLQVEQVIRGCVGIEGIYDLELTDRDYPTYRAMFIVAAFGADTQLWHDASPVFQGEPGSEAAISVPWILIHSPDDELVNQAQTDAFAAHLAELGNTHVKSVNVSGRHWAVVDRLASAQDEITPHLLELVHRTAATTAQ